MNMQRLLPGSLCAGGVLAVTRYSPDPLPEKPASSGGSYDAVASYEAELMLRDLRKLWHSVR